MLRRPSHVHITRHMAKRGAAKASSRSQPQSLFLHSFAMQSLVSILSVFLLIGSCASERAISKSSGPPAFFLQDPTDGLCLAGNKYKRCALDTLWYVVGKPGSYQIHRRPVDEDQGDLCLDKAQCHLDESDVHLANCNHCGAKKWNILGDAQSGYALTEDGNKFCLKRKDDLPTIVKCDKGYSSFSLQCKLSHPILLPRPFT